MANWFRLKTFGAVCLGASLALTSAGVLAVGDVLDTPSMETALAPKDLLTDVARAGDRLVAVGARGHIIYSQDAGKSWKQARVPVSTLLTAVYFPSAEQGWAVGHGGVVLHSADGGLTWSKQLDGIAEAKMVINQLETQVADVKQQLASAASDQKNQLENRLQQLQANLSDAQYDQKIGPWKPLLDVWFGNDRTGFVVGSYGLIFRTDDGGKTWQNWADRIPNPNQYHLNSIAEITGGALFIVGEAGNIFESTDQGDTWTALHSPYQGSLFGVMGTGNVNEVLTFGLRGHIFRSDDLGKHWQAVPSDSDSTLNSGTRDANGRIVLTGNDGAVLISSDAGRTFRAYHRSDRNALLAATVLPQGNLLVVGEKGTERTGPNGKDL